MAFDNVIGPVTVYSEASSGTSADREGVAYSLLNRAKQPERFEPTPAACAVQLEQYSCFNGDKKNRANLLRVMRAPDNDPVVLACITAWIFAQQHPELDPTHGATHYHEKIENPKPDWTVGATLTLTTDSFCFWANVK